MLPKAPHGFEWVELSGGSALVCRSLALIARHFFTTRSWALGSSTPGDNDAWREIARAAGVSRVLRLKQVHGTDVVVHRRGTDIFDTPPPADIIATDDDGIVIAVQTADCVPLLIGDRRTGAVAAAHAGWRGLAARVPAVAVDALVSRFDSRPDDLVVAVGPSIGACCYEVGEDVRTAFDRTFGPIAAGWFHHAPVALATNPPFRALRAHPGRSFFDTWAAARDQLADAGVPADQIHVAALCTASHGEGFCSYRRDGTGAGRIAGAIRPTDPSSSPRR